MSDELLFGGQDPLHSISDVIDDMTTAPPTTRQAMVAALSVEFNRRGLCRVDANRVAAGLGAVAARQRLADAYADRINKAA